MLSISKKYNDTKLKSNSLLTKLKEENKQLKDDKNNILEENEKLKKKLSCENDSYNNEISLLQKENEK